jgi:hypothetical protein
MAVFCAWSVQSDYKEEFSRVEFRNANLPGYELGSRGIELSWQMQNIGTKVIRLCREGFMCDFK